MDPAGRLPLTPDERERLFHLAAAGDREALSGLAEGGAWEELFRLAAAGDREAWGLVHPLIERTVRCVLAELVRGDGAVALSDMVLTVSRTLFGVAAGGLPRLDASAAQGCGYFFACIANTARRKLWDAQPRGPRSRAVTDLLTRVIGDPPFRERLDAARDLPTVANILTEVIHSDDVVRILARLGVDPSRVAQTVRRWLLGKRPDPSHPPGTSLPEGWQSHASVADTVIAWLRTDARRAGLAVTRPPESLDQEAPVGADEDEPTAATPAVESGAEAAAAVHVALEAMDDHYARMDEPPRPVAPPAVDTPSGEWSLRHASDVWDGPRPRSLQGQVVELILLGWTKNQIAAGLALAPETVVERAERAREFLHLHHGIRLRELHAFIHDRS